MNIRRIQVKNHFKNQLRKINPYLEKYSVKKTNQQLLGLSQNFMTPGF